MAIGRRLATLGRAPVPEWQELAWAGAPPSRLPGARWLADRFLLVVAVPHLALLVALLTGSVLASVVCWAVAALLDWAATRSDGPVSRIVDTAGASPVLRGALRSLMVAGALAGTSAVAGYVVAVLVIQLAWIGVVAFATGFSRNAPPLRYLPGAEEQPEPLAGYARFYRGATGTPLGFVLAEAVAMVGAVLLSYQQPMSGWFLLAGGALLALAIAGTAVLGFRRLLGRAATDAESLIAALAVLDPRYLTHISLGAGQSRYIANQWLPVLDATGINGVLAVREASQLLPLRPTRVPVVYAPSPRQVEQLTLPGMAVAFYLAYGEKNAHLLRNPALTHVMLLHGDSDKATSANAQVRGFDEIWVAGQAAIDRYRAAGITLPADRFVVIGRPQVEPLLASLPREPGDRPVVLYAPTFEGYYEETAHSSLDVMGPAMVRRLLAAFPQLQIWFKPHPASGVLRPAMLVAISEIEQLLTGGDHVLVDHHPELTLTDCLARADVLLSDVSSVISDFLATRRPVVVTNPEGLPPQEYRARYPSQRASYLVGPDLTGFDEAIADALGDDPLRPEREALVGYLLGDLPDGPQAAFDAALVRLSR